MLRNIYVKVCTFFGTICLTSHLPFSVQQLDAFTQAATSFIVWLAPVLLPHTSPPSLLTSLLQWATKSVPSLLPGYWELSKRRQSQEWELPCQIHQVLSETGGCMHMLTPVEGHWIWVPYRSLILFRFCFLFCKHKHTHTHTHINTHAHLYTQSHVPAHSNLTRSTWGLMLKRWWLRWWRAMRKSPVAQCSCHIFLSVVPQFAPA